MSIPPSNAFPSAGERTPVSPKPPSAATPSQEQTNAVGQAALRPEESPLAGAGPSPETALQTEIVNYLSKDPAAKMVSFFCLLHTILSVESLNSLYFIFTQPHPEVRAHLLEKRIRSFLSAHPPVNDPNGLLQLALCFADASQIDKIYEPLEKLIPPLPTQKIDEGGSETWEQKFLRLCDNKATAYISLQLRQFASIQKFTSLITAESFKSKKFEGSFGRLPVINDEMADLTSRRGLDHLSPSARQAIDSFLGRSIKLIRYQLNKASRVDDQRNNFIECESLTRAGELLTQGSGNLEEALEFAMQKISFVYDQISSKIEEDFSDDKKAYQAIEDYFYLKPYLQSLPKSWKCPSEFEFLEQLRSFAATNPKISQEMQAAKDKSLKIRRERDSVYKFFKVLERDGKRNNLANALWVRALLALKTNGIQNLHGDFKHTVLLKDTLNRHYLVDLHGDPTVTVLSRKERRVRDLGTIPTVAIQSDAVPDSLPVGEAPAPELAAVSKPTAKSLEEFFTEDISKRFRLENDKAKNAFINGWLYANDLYALLKRVPGETLSPKQVAHRVLDIFVTAHFCLEQILNAHMLEINPVKEEGAFLDLMGELGHSLKKRLHQSEIYSFITEEEYSFLASWEGIEYLIRDLSLAATQNPLLAACDRLLQGGSPGSALEILAQAEGEGAKALQAYIRLLEVFPGSPLSSEEGEIDIDEALSRRSPLHLAEERGGRARPPGPLNSLFDLITAAMRGYSDRDPYKKHLMYSLTRLEHFYEGLTHPYFSRLSEIQIRLLLRDIIEQVFYLAGDRMGVDLSFSHNLKSHGEALRLASTFSKEEQSFLQQAHIMRNEARYHTSATLGKKYQKAQQEDSGAGVVAPSAGAGVAEEPGFTTVLTGKSKEMMHSIEREIKLGESIIQKTFRNLSPSH